MRVYARDRAQSGFRVTHCAFPALRRASKLALGDTFSMRATALRNPGCDPACRGKSTAIRQNVLHKAFLFIATVASEPPFWLYPRDFGWVRSFSYSTRRSCVGQWARQALSNQDWIP